ncbi:MAG TPA: hypothetical protein VEU33_10670 [Archangium sp.]|nr:hypothetical protein [Archangium sp.]
MTITSPEGFTFLCWGEVGVGVLESPPGGPPGKSFLSPREQALLEGAVSPQRQAEWLRGRHVCKQVVREVLGPECPASQVEVLPELLGFISVDEFRHAEGGYQILTKLLERKPELKPEVLRAASNFQALRLARVRAAGGGGERLHHGAADEAQVREGVRRAHRELARGVGQPPHHPGRRRRYAAARAPLEQPSFPLDLEHHHGF